MKLLGICKAFVWSVWCWWRWSTYTRRMAGSYKDKYKVCLNYFPHTILNNIIPSRWKNIQIFENAWIFSKGKRFNHISTDGKREVVEILETATYLVCQDSDITQEYFRKILNSRNVPLKLFRAADQNGDGDLSISEVMDFLVVLTKPT